MSEVLGASTWRAAWRALRRQPLFAAGAIATFALALAASIAIFAIARAVLFAPLPVADPDRLVSLASIWRGEPASVSPPNFIDLRDRRDLFATAGAEVSSSVALSGDGAAEQLQRSEVTGEFFRVLGLGPELGRLLEPEDVDGAGRKVVVVSHGLWVRRFGSDPALVGRTLRLDGEGYEVVGVARAGVEFPAGTEVWMPLVLPPGFYDQQRGAQYLNAIARLAPNVLVEAADAEVRSLALSLRERFPQAMGPELSFLVRDLREALVASSRPPVAFVALAVGLVLLIACANVANLLTARAVDRQREIAVRSALGAGRRHLVAELLAESVLLGLAGGLAGIAGARLVVELVSNAGVPWTRIEEARLDAGAWAFGLALAVAGSLLASLPAVVSVMRRAATTEGLVGNAERAGEGRRSRTLRHGLTAFQIALAAAVLALGVLLGRSLMHLAATDLGLRPDGALTFSVNLPDREYRPVERAAAFADDLNERLRALPGVESSGAIFGLPLTGFAYSISTRERDGQPLTAAEQERLTLRVRVVTPGLFRALGTGLVAGRSIAPEDRAGAPAVVVVNEAAARLLWPGENALGRRVVVSTTLGLGGGRLGGEVVGVVEDTRDRGPADPGQPTIYASHAQMPVGFLSFVVRTRPGVDPMTLAPLARALVGEMDPNLPVFRISSLDQLARSALAGRRLLAVVVGVFGLGATILASVGVWAVLGFTVARRRREIGIRLAVGARPRDVASMVVGDGMRWTFAGLVAGLTLAIVAGRSLRASLYGVAPHDPATLVAVALIITAAAFAATWAPARRAARTEPSLNLRQD